MAGAAREAGAVQAVRPLLAAALLVIACAASPLERRIDAALERAHTEPALRTDEATRAAANDLYALRQGSPPGCSVDCNRPTDEELARAVERLEAASDAAEWRGCGGRCQK